MGILSFLKSRLMRGSDDSRLERKSPPVVSGAAISGLTGSRPAAEPIGIKKAQRKPAPDNPRPSLLQYDLTQAEQRKITQPCPGQGSAPTSTAGGPQKTLRQPPADNLVNYNLTTARQLALSQPAKVASETQTKPPATREPTSNTCQKTRAGVCLSTFELTTARQLALSKPAPKQQEGAIAKYAAQARECEAIPKSPQGAQSSLAAYALTTAQQQALCCSSKGSCLSESKKEPCTPCPISGSRLALHEITVAQQLALRH